VTTVYPETPAELRIIDKDDPDSGPAATQAVTDKVEQAFRKAMQAFVATHGPVRVLEVEAVAQQGPYQPRRHARRYARFSGTRTAGRGTYAGA